MLVSSKTICHNIERNQTTGFLFIPRMADRKENSSIHTDIMLSVKWLSEVFMNLLMFTRKQRYKYIIPSTLQMTLLLHREASSVFLNSYKPDNIRHIPNLKRLAWDKNDYDCSVLYHGIVFTICGIVFTDLENGLSLNLLW